MSSTLRHAPLQSSNLGAGARFVPGPSCTIVEVMTWLRIYFTGFKCSGYCSELESDPGPPVSYDRPFCDDHGIVRTNLN